MILATCHLGGALVEVLPADPVMDAHLGATEPAEPTFGFAGAGPIFAPELAGVIDPHHQLWASPRLP
jgi:hypothetical protein